MTVVALIGVRWRSFGWMAGARRCRDERATVGPATRGDPRPRTGRHRVLHAAVRRAAVAPAVELAVGRRHTGPRAHRAVAVDPVLAAGDGDLDRHRRAAGVAAGPRRLP